MTELRKKVAYWPSDNAAMWRDVREVCLEPDGKRYTTHDSDDGYYVTEDDGERTYLNLG